MRQSRDVGRRLNRIADCALRAGEHISPSRREVRRVGRRRDRRGRRAADRRFRPEVAARFVNRADVFVVFRIREVGAVQLLRLAEQIGAMREQLVAIFLRRLGQVVGRLHEPHRAFRGRVRDELLGRNARAREVLHGRAELTRHDRLVVLPGPLSVGRQRRRRRDRTLQTGNLRIALRIGEKIVHVLDLLVIGLHRRLEIGLSGDDFLCLPRFRLDARLVLLGVIVHVGNARIVRVGNAVLRHVDALGPVHFLDGRVARDARVRFGDLANRGARAFRSGGRDERLEHARVHVERLRPRVRIVDEVGITRLRLVVLLQLHNAAHERARVAAALPAHRVDHGGAIARLSEAGRQHAEASIEALARLLALRQLQEHLPEVGRGLGGLRLRRRLWRSPRAARRGRPPGAPGTPGPAAPAGGPAEGAGASSCGP